MYPGCKQEVTSVLRPLPRNRESGSRLDSEAQGSALVMLEHVVVGSLDGKEIVATLNRGSCLCY